MFVVNGSHSHYLVTQADLLSDDLAQAGWASKYIVTNPALKWVVANYMEADAPNRNGQFASLADLRVSHPTLTYAPMDIDHRQNYIVGTFVASEMQYPTTSEAGEGQGNPFIEVLGAIWKARNPQALNDIQRAYEQGHLAASMECVGESVTCASEGACGQTFPYKGPWSKSYCDCMQKPDRIQQVNKPHFLGGAMILPPNRPGWAGADVKVVAALVKEYAGEAEKVFASLTEQTPTLTPEEAEQVTLDLMVVAKTDPIHIGRRLAAIYS